MLYFVLYWGQINLTKLKTIFKGQPTVLGNALLWIDFLCFSSVISFFTLYHGSERLVILLRFKFENETSTLTKITHPPATTTATYMYLWIIHLCNHTVHFLYLIRPSTLCHTRFSFEKCQLRGWPSLKNNGLVTQKETLQTQNTVGMVWLIQKLWIVQKLDNASSFCIHSLFLLMSRRYVPQTCKLFLWKESASCTAFSNSFFFSSKGCPFPPITTIGWKRWGWIFSTLRTRKITRSSSLGSL